MRAGGRGLGVGLPAPRSRASPAAPRPRRLACKPACGPVPRMEGLDAAPADHQHGPRRVLDSASQLVDDALLVRDPLKEHSRVYQRTLSSFTWDRWASHRSTWRYLRHMRGIFNSSIVRGLAAPLTYVGTLATLVCCYEEALQDGLLPAYLPTLQLPTAPFDLTSFALSLLLVFRTNTSYDRWSTACNLWGSIANRSRDTLRQVLSGSLRGGAESPIPPAVCRWVLAFVWSLKAQLTEDSDLRKDLEGTLEPAELERLLASWHPPSFALAVLSELVGHAGGAGLREAQCVRLDENLTALEGVLAACEGILRTPIPLSYTRHTSRFLVIWLSTLPLGLWSTGCHWGTVPLSLVIAFLLLGIEEIGVQIEEPFGLLPLHDICTEIQGDMHAMLRESDEAKATGASAAAAAGVAAAAAAGGATAAAPGGHPTGLPGAVGSIALFSAVRRKLGGSDGTKGGSEHSGGTLAEAGQGAAARARREWAEVGGTRTSGGPSAARGAAADAIFSSMDERDV